MSNVEIRKAKREDMINVWTKNKTTFEGFPNGVKITAADLERDGFDSEQPHFFCLIAEFIDTKTLVGYALGNYAYSSWTGRAMYLEDFYVISDLRGQKIGHRLFKEMCKMARDDGCHRIDWHCLIDNLPALKFYESHGGYDVCKDEARTCYRIKNKEILKVANADD